MARARYTVRTLCDELTRINGYLESEGIPARFEHGGRNGYQAVDEYTVDADGKRQGSGVDRNVCCGSSRECGEAAWRRKSELDNCMLRAKCAALQARAAWAGRNDIDD
jgi:hypothetical protein